MFLLVWHNNRQKNASLQKYNINFNARRKKISLNKDKSYILDLENCIPNIRHTGYFV